MANDLKNVPECGQCEDGYITEPPLQDGGLCSVYKCPACRELAERYWSQNDDT